MFAFALLERLLTSTAEGSDGADDDSQKEQVHTEDEDSDTQNNNDPDEQRRKEKEHKKKEQQSLKAQTSPLIRSPFHNMTSRQVNTTYGFITE